LSKQASIESVHIGETKILEIDKLALCASAPITLIPQRAPALNEGWLDLGGAAAVEVTSGKKEYPVEAAQVAGEIRG
jgi:hypothetical protein